MAFGIIGSAFGLVGGLVFAVIAALVSGLLLWITAKLFKLKGGFGTAFMIALVVGIASWAINFVFGFIPFVGGWLGGLVGIVVSILLGISLIKSKYHQDTGKAIVIWLVWFVLSFIATGILALIAGVLFAGAAIAAGAGSLLLGR